VLVTALTIHRAQNKRVDAATYISWKAQRDLTASVSRLYEPFSRGFRATIRTSNALPLLHHSELYKLLGGADQLVDVGLLRVNAVLEGFDVCDSQPDWLFDVLETADNERRRAFLAFVTGTAAISALGSAAVVLRVQKWVGGAGSGERVDGTWLPSSQTCFNSIKLPGYASKEVLEAKLWMAVEGAKGTFGLR